VKGETELSHRAVADEGGSAGFLSSDPDRGGFVGRTTGFLSRWWKLILIALSTALVYPLPVFPSVGSAGPFVAVLAALSVTPAAAVAVRLRSLVADDLPMGVLSASAALGVIAVGFAYVTSTTAVGYFDADSFLAAGFLFYAVVAPVEEAFKLVAVYVYPTDTDYFRTAADVAVFGAFVGVGFAGAENLLYFVTEGVEVATLEVFVGRMLVAPVHVILSSIAGYYLGVALLNRHRRRRAALVLLKGLLLVVFLHGTHNAVVTYLPAAVALSPLPNGFGFRATNLVLMSAFYCATWCVLRGLLSEKVVGKEGRA